MPSHPAIDHDHVVLHRRQAEQIINIFRTIQGVEQALRRSAPWPMVTDKLDALAKAGQNARFIADEIEHLLEE